MRSSSSWPLPSARACSPPPAPSPWRPACTPAARCRTSSRCAMPPPRRSCGGTTTSRCRPRPSTCCGRTFNEHIKTRRLYVQDLYAGADPSHRLNARIFTELAWHALFIRNLLRKPKAGELASFKPEFTVINLPSFKADPKRHGVRSETVIACNFAKRLVLIGGTSYAGETKKSVFTYLNFVMPDKGVMPMHCSANVGPKGDSAIFFGLSGTGKTTLSADPKRTLLGRRRARLVQGRRLQFRGRLLRQDHPPLRRGRARDLGRHQPLRHGAGERHPRSRNARARLRRRTADREHTLGLSAGVHLQRQPHGRRRPSQEHRHADRRRLRRDAADRQALAEPGHVPLPLRLHRQGRRHREGPGQGAAGHLLHLLRRAVHAAPSRRPTATCCAS